jgi:PDZ domain-containing secreted protein
MNQYQNINYNLIWICVISLLAYFIFLPFNYTRPTPAQNSPQNQETTQKERLKLEANPLMLMEHDVNLENLINNPTSTTDTLKNFPKALTPLGE